MAHFAELDENNVVIYVAYVNNEDCLDEFGNESEEVGIAHLHKHNGADRIWKQTSYNRNFRGEYAGIGFTYNEQLDVFLSPKPYPSWVLNELTKNWESPIGDHPELTEQEILGGVYYLWDEESLQWIKINPPVQDPEQTP